MPGKRLQNTQIWADSLESEPGNDDFEKATPGLQLTLSSILMPDRLQVFPSEWV